MIKTTLEQELDVMAKETQCGIGKWRFVVRLKISRTVEQLIESKTRRKISNISFFTSKITLLKQTTMASRIGNAILDDFLALLVLYCPRDDSKW